MNKIQDLFNQLSETDSFSSLKQAAIKAREISQDRNLDSVDALVAFAKEQSIHIEFISDLPEKTQGGLAIEIEGEKVIFADKHESDDYNLHTIRHELGHHLLNHLPGSKQREPYLEFEANLFALFLFMFGRKNVNDYLRENPEVFLYIIVMALSALSIVVGGAAWESRDWIVKQNNKRKIE